MNKLGLIGLGVFMIGMGIPSISSVGGALMVAGGVVVIISAFVSI